jgi:hypothetical protein
MSTPRQELRVHESRRIHYIMGTIPRGPLIHHRWVHSRTEPSARVALSGDKLTRFMIPWMQCLNRLLGDWSTWGHGSSRSPISSLLNGREMLTESSCISKCARTAIKGHTDRNKQILSSPDLCKSLDKLWLGSNIPTELFLSSTISVEKSTPDLVSTITIPHQVWTYLAKEGRY